MIVHFFAAARAAAGRPSLEVNLDKLSAKSPATLADLLDYLKREISGSTAGGMTFAQVLDQCSFLLDGAAAQPDTVLQAAKRLDVLPPFAGG